MEGTKEGLARRSTSICINNPVISKSIWKNDTHPVQALQNKDYLLAKRHENELEPAQLNLQTKTGTQSSSLHS